MNRCSRPPPFEVRSLEIVVGLHESWILALRCRVSGCVLRVSGFGCEVSGRRVTKISRKTLHLIQYSLNCDQWLVGAASSRDNPGSRR